MQGYIKREYKYKEKPAKLGNPVNATDYSISKSGSDKRTTDHYELPGKFTGAIRLEVNDCAFNLICIFFLICK